MKVVYSTQDVLFAGHLRNLLLQEGIPCEIRTPFLAAARGDIPLTECWSQLRIVNDGDLEKAVGVIEGALAHGAEPSGSRKCSRCGEEIESQFEVCWQCGSAVPE